MKIGNSMDKPIPAYIMEQLLNQEEFVKSYSETGLTIDEFDNYGATLRTLKQFSEGYDDLIKIIRKFMIAEA